ncbi:MAG: T9SS type A sorting domain-containing protein [Bacteroidetes bacterium]|nr:T9SS type A sorting domain-containing protein [Bacteroidota bacterium]
MKQPKNFSVAGGGSISAINYSPINPNYWYLLTTGGNFYYSTDAGDTWTMTSGFDGPGSHYFYGASIEPSKTTLGVVYIGGSGYDNPAVYVSEDNGVSFTGLTDGMPSTLVYDLAISTNDSLLFAATEVAPYVYVKAENKWYDLSGVDAPLQTYWSVDFVDEIQSVRFGTYGRGTWAFKLYEEPEVIAVDDINDVEVLKVYPNPAVNSVQLLVSAFIPDATIDIIDMQGNIVTSKNAAINKNIPYKLNVNNLGAGQYFIRITGRGAPLIEKLIITK